MSHTSQAEKSHYAGGNSFNDDMPIPVFSMDNSDFRNITESTQIMNVTPISVSNEEIIIHCYECNYQCASETLLTLHMKKHRSVSTYHCDKCDFSTSSMDGLFIHKSSNHIEQEHLSITTIDVFCKKIYQILNVNL